MSDSKKSTLTIGGLYEVLQGQLSATLHGLRRVIDHPGIKGEVSEEDWKNLLRKYLPGRYSIETKVKVIDSRDGVSDQIDLAIFDGQYAPFIYRTGGLCCIPAESIYAIFEIKQQISKGTIAYARRKAKSVQKLYRTSTAVTQIGGAIRKKELFNIFGGVLATTSTPSVSRNPKKYLGTGATGEVLEIGCSLDGFCFVVEGKKILSPRDKRKSLMFFCFKLFKKLQQLGTAPAVDVDEYLKNV